MPASTRPPRAVSRTATSTSFRRRIAWAPAGTRPVAGVDHPLVDEDPVRRRRADVAAGSQQDVGDQAGHRRLAVGAGDRDRPASGGRRRGSTTAASARAPAIRACQRSTTRAWVPVSRVASRGRDAARRQVERGLGDQARPLGAGPRPGDDPASRCPTARGPRTGPPCSPWSARRRRVHATRSATASGHSRAGTDRPRWTSAVASASAIPARSASARPRPRP